jgi:hypothetical protein
MLIYHFATIQVKYLGIFTTVCKIRIQQNSKNNSKEHLAHQMTTTIYTMLQKQTSMYKILYQNIRLLPNLQYRQSAHEKENDITTSKNKLYQASFGYQNYNLRALLKDADGEGTALYNILTPVFSSTKGSLLGLWEDDPVIFFFVADILEV